MHSKRRCDGTCGRLINTRNLFRKNGGAYCSHCIKKFRKIINLGVVDPNNPPKDVLKSLHRLGEPLERKRRTPAEMEEARKEKPIIPILRGAKKSRGFVGSRYSHLYFTKVEKVLLYKKYVSNGLTEDQARTRLDSAIGYMKDFIEKLKMKGVEEQELNKRFKEEFAKLVEKQ